MVRELYSIEGLREAFPHFTDFKGIQQNESGGVFSAYSPRLADHLALKLVRANGQDTTHAQRFEQEYGLLADTFSERLVQVLHYGIAAVRMRDRDPVIHYWYTMKLYLGSVMAYLPTLSLPTRVAVINQMLDGLSFLHTLGIVHRDIKPHNVFIARLDPLDVKIGDFGIAKHLSGLPASATLTGTSLDQTMPKDPRSMTIIGGTPSYLAPERLDPEYLSQQQRDWMPSDQYATGATVYQILSIGHLPLQVQGHEWAHIRHSHQQRPLRELAVPEFPGRRFPETDRVIAKMMAVRPQDRYPRISSAKNALEVAFAADMLTRGR